MSSNIKIKRVCVYCNKEFTARTTKTKYCSLDCNRKDYKKRMKEKKIQASNKETSLKINKPLFDIQEKEFLNVKEASILLGCSVRTMYRLIEKGQIKSVNLGQRITRIKRSELNKLF
ncbi:MAG: helix-turn-helix domain-containing protein [Chlorobi bacterium]|nr:helix-turn-helix domain-containing protein [Chlorobiota bacterium]